MGESLRTIGEYGVIGDLHTVALVGMDGSIDFLWPAAVRLAVVFAALVDAEARRTLPDRAAPSRAPRASSSISPTPTCC